LSRLGGPLKVWDAVVHWPGGGGRRGRHGWWVATQRLEARGQRRQRGAP
jgi:hypothetical protein